MKDLSVYIEIKGIQLFAGRITGTGPEDAVFTYRPEYLDLEVAAPVSLNLPLQGSPFTVEQTRIFFEGLLPEGFTRKSVASWLHTDENDYLTILEGLGRECLGAIQVTKGDAASSDSASAYRKMTMVDLQRLAAEGAVESAQLVTEAHISLTGASGKVGLYYDPDEKEWFLPLGSAPSTHIVKQSHVRLDSIVLNERLTLMTASKLGIDVPESFIIDSGGGRDQDLLFATRRYDRDIMSGRLISGKPCPFRRHQEDFGQAMGIPSKDKYEKNRAGYLKRCTELLRFASADPIRDILKLWDISVFNWLVGNADNHIKNLSVLYAPDLKSLRLAPAYDLVSTAVYMKNPPEMSMSIGGIYPLDEITSAAWEREAAAIGMNPKMGLGRLNKMADALKECMYASADELTAEGIPGARDMAERILDRGGIAYYQ